jgi:hypothetical protein
MKIQRFSQYSEKLNEMNDTPESYITTALNKLKRKVDKMFAYLDGKTQGGKILTPEGLEKVDPKDITFKDLGLHLDSSEVSKYSKLYDSFTIKFRDANNAYTMIVMIGIEEAMPEESEEQFGQDNIENAYIKFKKYGSEGMDLIGQMDKNVKIKDIDEAFLIDLKIELDDEYDENEDEFEIQT